MPDGAHLLSRGTSSSAGRVHCSCFSDRFFIRFVLLLVSLPFSLPLQLLIFLICVILSFFQFLPSPLETQMIVPHSPSLLLGGVALPPPFFLMVLPSSYSLRTAVPLPCWVVLLGLFLLSGAASPSSFFWWCCLSLPPLGGGAFTLSSVADAGFPILLTLVVLPSHPLSIGWCCRSFFKSLN